MAAANFLVNISQAVCIRVWAGWTTETPLTSELGEHLRSHIEPGWSPITTTARVLVCAIFVAINCWFVASLPLMDILIAYSTDYRLCIRSDRSLLRFQDSSPYNHTTRCLITDQLSCEYNVFISLLYMLYLMSHAVARAKRVSSRISCKLQPVMQKGEIFYACLIFNRVWGESLKFDRVLACSDEFQPEPATSCWAQLFAILRR